MPGCPSRSLPRATGQAGTGDALPWANRNKPMADITPSQRTPQAEPRPAPAAAPPQPVLNVRVEHVEAKPTGQPSEPTRPAPPPPAAEPREAPRPSHPAPTQPFTERVPEHVA